MKKQGRSVFAGVFLITVLVIIMVAGIISLVENSCQARFETHLPIYPNASLVSSESKFLQYRQAKYFTPESVDVVKKWYNTAIYVALSESLAKTGTRGTVWDGAWDIQAADQGGSTITLSRGCG